jgi:hypothetical protein
MSLFKSRKFWLAVIAVIQTVIGHFIDLSPEVTEAITRILIFLMGFIAVEDSAKKLSGRL